MRIFDGIGIATVAIWLGVISITAWNTHHKPPAVHTQSDQVVLTEGESWMVLRRNDADIGFIHESRTLLDNRWLLEYQTLISVSMLGTEQTFKSTVKATVDQHAVIQSFTSDLNVMDNAFSVTGEVTGDTLNITTHTGNAQTTKSIPLTAPPRLAANVFNRLVATAPKQGDWFEEVFFDPSSMDLVNIKIQYIEPSQTEVWEERYDSHKFTRHTAGAKFNAIAATDGTVLIQEFPLDIIGSRVPPAIGRAKAMTLRSQTNKKKQSQKDANKPVDIGLDTAMKMLNQITGSTTSGPTANTAAIPGKYTITNVPDAIALELNSNRQYITAQTEESRTIDTKFGVGSDAPSIVFPPETLAELLESSARIDGSATNIQQLIKTQNIAKLAALATDQETTTRYADAIIESIHLAMKPEPNIAVLSASQALELGRGDCTEYALITVAALRQAGIPARFVHGLLYDKEDKMIPHQWIQFFDGKRFIDRDPTRNNAEVSFRHIQLFTSATPEHPNFLQAINKLSIQPTLP